MSVIVTRMEINLLNSSASQYNDSFALSSSYHPFTHESEGN